MIDLTSNRFTPSGRVTLIRIRPFAIALTIWPALDLFHVLQTISLLAASTPLNIASGRERQRP